MVPITQSIDTQGLSQHQPFLRAFSAMRKLQCGDVLMLSTSEPQADDDLQAFCYRTGFQLIESVRCEDEYIFLIRRNCTTEQAA
ncbi:MAG TPA: sulfurtransferase TusA family protein [Gammaproteobacteria bacterium]|nr:sulfurtransferase TusA family protein [Gammaproteobacteria bacterium]